MSWTRRCGAALAVCVLLLTGSAGCGAGDTQEPQSPPPSSGPYREMAEDADPEVGIEVQPDGADWAVRLTLRDFRLSPSGTPSRAAPGRGVARLYLDGREIAVLRTPEYRLPASLVPRGTHEVTARLYADDGRAWAVDGEPVQATADITASGSPGGQAGTEGAGERPQGPDQP
jgi:hypothetical protein